MRTRGRGGFGAASVRARGRGRGMVTGRGRGRGRGGITPGASTQMSDDKKVCDCVELKMFLVTLRACQLCSG